MATTAEEALRWVNKLHAQLVKRRHSIKKQFAYVEGQQPLVYATAEWKRFHSERYKDFADNWCAVVANAPVNRLRIDGFRLSDSTSLLTADEQELWKDWNRNELQSESKAGFLASVIAKRSSTFVWGSEDNEPIVTWEHPSQMIVAYSQGGRRQRLAALKSWIDDDGTEYATLVLPDGLYKFDRKAAVQVSEGRTESGLHVIGAVGSGGWKVREVAGETWPLPNPLGEVSVVEWLNRPLLGGKPLSDIDGTMAMQDAINALWAYLFSAADYASMPARVVTGGEPPKVPILDEAGQVIGSRPAKMEDLAQGRLLFLPGANAKIDQWDAANLDAFGKIISQCIGHVAAQTSTPGHYLLTNEKFANLNGDALTAAEVPLVDKAQNEQLSFNPAAKETARLMAKVRGKDGMAEEIRGSDKFVQWKNPAMHSLAQVADAATKDRAVGMSLRTVLQRRFEMTEAEIDQEFDRIREEREDDVLGFLDPVTRAGLKGRAGGDTNPDAGA